MIGLAWRELIKQACVLVEDGILVVRGFEWLSGAWLAWLPNIDINIWNTLWV